jgi:hypothetical protein
MRSAIALQGSDNTPSMWGGGVAVDTFASPGAHTALPPKQSLQRGGHTSATE